MDTILHESQLVQSIHTEYLKLINYYQNISRPGFFVKYFNLNIADSTVLEELESTYNIYSNSDLKFDVYDLTPAYGFQELLNKSAPVNDLKGQMLDTQTSITVYTIKRPRIHDLISFYPPIQSDEIFRVTNITTPVNALHSNPSLTWFTLDLEYAPVENINNLRLNKSYVYDLSTEQYLNYQDYIQYINNLKSLSELFKNIKQYYNNYYDVYMINEFIPYALNEVIIQFKKEYGQKFKRLFDDIPTPYGILDIPNYKQYSIPYKDMTNDLYYLYDLNKSKEIQYKWHDKKLQLNNIEQLLNLGFLVYMELNK